MSSTSSVKATRFLSGVQPSGALHIGNYFGAIQNHINLQHRPNSDCLYFVADYHALTTVRDADALRSNVQNVVLDYLALGLDPAKATFYVQSDIPEVNELYWLLGTVTGKGLLERGVSYKDKVSRGISADFGLFAYPLLMAADILGPRADVVPVGADQRQHLEMTQKIAAYFHVAYRCKIFTLPRYETSATPRVPGTTFDKFGQVALRMKVGGNLERARDELRRIRIELAEEVARLPKDGARFETTVRGILAPKAEQLGVELELTNLKPDLTVESDEQGMPTAIVTVIPLDTPAFAADNGKRRPAKMSKSYHNTIEIFAEGERLKKMVMGIETDARGMDERIDPDDDLVFQLYSLFADEGERRAMREAYASPGYGYGHAKRQLLNRVEIYFGEARERRWELAKRPDDLADILRGGAAAARVAFRQTLNDARDACGLAR